MRTSTGKHGSILSPMTSHHRSRFPRPEALPDALQKRRCQIRTDSRTRSSRSVRRGVAQAFARLAIHIENGRILIVEKERIGAWSTKVRKRASLARSSRSACFSSVMSCRTPNWRRGRPEPSQVTSPWLWTTRRAPSGRTTLYSHVVAWTARAYAQPQRPRLLSPGPRGESIPAMPLRNHGCTPKIRQPRLKAVTPPVIKSSLPPTNMRDPLRLFQPDLFSPSSSLHAPKLRR